MRRILGRFKPLLNDHDSGFASEAPLAAFTTHFEKGSDSQFSQNDTYVTGIAQADHIFAVTRKTALRFAI
jgi:hypothetical protein